MNTLVLLAAAVAATSPAALAHESEADFTPRTAFERRADFSADQTPQIRAHLAEVISVLEARDVSGLSAAQRAARLERIDRLAEYSLEGEFPVNVHAPYPTPVFIDLEGRHCAVGDLMRASGAGELAREISLVQNLAYVQEITVSGVAVWARESGLTLDECAMIQPTYGPCGTFNPGQNPMHSRVCTPAVPNSYTQTFGSILGAVATPCGSLDVALNDFRIVLDYLPSGGTAGILLCSRSMGLAVNPGGSQGNLCLGDPVGRFNVQPFSAFANPWIGGGTAFVSVNLTGLPMPGGAVPVLPGDTWYFQAWYRDANPHPTSNFSDAVSVTFQ